MISRALEWPNHTILPLIELVDSECMSNSAKNFMKNRLAPRPVIGSCCATATGAKVSSPTSTSELMSGSAESHVHMANSFVSPERLAWSALQHSPADGDLSARAARNMQLKSSANEVVATHLTLVFVVCHCLFVV